MNQYLILFLSMALNFATAQEITVKVDISNKEYSVYINDLKIDTIEVEEMVNVKTNEPSKVNIFEGFGNLQNTPTLNLISKKEKERIERVVVE